LLAVTVMTGNLRTSGQASKFRIAATMRVTMASVLIAAFAISASAQDATTQTGAPADAFPQPDRPVADIISPIWHDEIERDKAGEPQ
jgi:hypothetical protein